MSTLSMAATSRKEKGKQFAKQMRREGKIPAVLYGKSGNFPLVVDPKELTQLLSSDTKLNTVIKLNYTGDNSGEVYTIVRQVQRHPLSRKVIHADFKEIDLNEAIVTNVPVELEGTAIGIKQDGGKLSFRLKSLTVQALPQKVPAKFTLDVTSLRAGFGIKISGIDAPEGVKFLQDADLDVVVVTMPKVEEKAAEEEVEMI